MEKIERKAVHFVLFTKFCPETKKGERIKQVTRHAWDKFFLFAFIGYNRVSPTRYTTGYLQRWYKLIPFANCRSEELDVLGVSVLKVLLIVSEFVEWINMAQGGDQL